jgi:hypothetical protein
MPANSTIVQLRQILADRFPNAQATAAVRAEAVRPGWPTGVPQLDDLLQGGLPQGAITELLVPRPTCGSALLLSRLLQQAQARNQWIALVDGCDSFDPAGLDAKTLERILWVRCETADQALKATDLLLRDGNLPMVLLDLAANPAAQLRKIPLSAWYRLQRILEQNATAMLLFTPSPMAACAQAKLTLSSRFSLEALAGNEEEMWHGLKVELRLPQLGGRFEPQIAQAS